MPFRTDAKSDRQSYISYFLTPDLYTSVMIVTLVYFSGAENGVSGGEW